MFISMFCKSLLISVIAAAAQLAWSEPARDTILSAAQFETKPVSPASRRQEPDFASVAVSRDGLAKAGLAVFYPVGSDEKSAAATSLAVVEYPVIGGPLPADWRLRPVFSSNGRRFRAELSMPAEVDLYGGGEVVGPLRRNGTTIKLWNTDNLNYGKDNGSRLYQSHPWIMGVRPDGTAFGVIFDSTWKAELDCRNDIVFTAEGPAFPVIVMDRESPAAVLEMLGMLVGRMELPPLWALGYQQCRFSYTPDSRVKEIAKEFRSRKLPCDVLWLDIDYMSQYRVFTFDKKSFPDPKGLNDFLHRNGFKAVWMIDPGVKVDEAYSVYQDGHAKDVFVKTAAGKEYHGDVWPGLCAFPDFTSPEARAWWGGNFPAYLATGIDGVWNDMNEPAVFRGPDGTMPEDNQHKGGDGLAPGPHRQYHNVYGLLMTRATKEGVLRSTPGKRPFVLTRSNFLGGQRYAATWTGDNFSSESHMKASVPMSLTLGLSGQPFNGPDLGGFNGRATPQLWSQWVGFGTLFPFARAHATKSGDHHKEPWMFGEAVERTARIALERRYRLLPYFYTLFREASVTGLPVMRPIFMSDPKDPALRREEGAFMLGNDLIVVPSWARNPALPHGKYPVVSLIDGDLQDPDQATLRIRPGAIIPLGVVIQNTTEKSLAPLTLLICLGANGQAEGCLYEDDGDGFDYRKGDYSLITYKARQVGDKAVVSISATKGTRPLTPRDVKIQIIQADGSLVTTTQKL